MTDSFALFGEPRRPWLEPEPLKAKFFALSAAVHPDRVHEAPEAERTLAHQRYTELNAAYQCLREPKDRLRHLLALETGAQPTQVHTLSADTTRWFTEVTQLCREVDRFLEERAQVTSPLLKVSWFERAQEWTDKLQLVQRLINERSEERIVRLKEMNAAWAAAPAVGTPHRAAALPLAQLEEIYRAISYLTRWGGQLQERVLQLSL
jgi:DnaJ-domain-containing protein 1